MKKGLNLLGEHKDQHFTLQSIPAENPRTYAMKRLTVAGLVLVRLRAWASPKA